MSSRRVAGAVLAGGRATRLGGVAKPLLALDGSPLVVHVVDALRAGLGPDALLTIAVADDERARAIEDVLADRDDSPMVLRDVVDDGGPIAGLIACLEAAGREGATDVVVIAADMPHVGGRWIARLAHEKPDAHVLLAAREEPEPMCARYSVSLAPLARERLARGWRSVLALARAAGFETLALDDASRAALDDVDTAEDAARLGIDPTAIVLPRAR